MTSELFFIGMSKNCLPNLEKNINYLIDFKNKSKFNVNICIIDSDSIDGTKTFRKNLLKKKYINEFIEVDDLEEEFSSRIERLSICRNKAIKYLLDCADSEFIYVPMDLDLDLFKLITFQELDELINYFINNEGVQGIFPYSVPFYYDIFALRKNDWVNGNNLLKARTYKDRFKIFTFIFNYFYIFSKQKNIKNFKSDLIKVDSAFGGMGMYKLKKMELNKVSYGINPNNINFYSEHLYFNNFFKNLYIYKKWNIVSPPEYTFFNTYSLKEKLVYILKTLKNDTKNLITK